VCLESRKTREDERKSLERQRERKREQACERARQRGEKMGEGCIVCERKKVCESERERASAREREELHGLCVVQHSPSHRTRLFISTRHSLEAARLSWCRGIVTYEL